MTTKVFWAGTISGRGVVSIFSNPQGQTGSNAPLNNPLAFLDRVYFDTRFQYLSVISESSFAINHGLVNVNTTNTKKSKTGADVPIERTSLTTILNHRLGYTPAAILFDLETNEGVGSNYIIQTANNNSIRQVSLIGDDNNLYLRERLMVRKDPLLSITKRYRLIVFNNTASVPEFPQ